MFVEYNKRLRDVVQSLKEGSEQEQPPHAKGVGEGEAEEKGVDERKYTTTIHAINGAIIKLSKLSQAKIVYRGISNGRLPREFIEEDRDKVMGGVEIAFMSTTMDRKVAEQYSGANVDDEKMAIIIQMQQGMVDRGADLTDISQYPAECEILFPPLTALQVVGRRVSHKTLIIDVRPTVNTNSLTITQVITKRAKLLVDMEANMRLEISRDLTNDELMRQRATAAKDAFHELLEHCTDFVFSDSALSPTPAVNAATGAAATAMTMADAQPMGPVRIASGATAVAPSVLVGGYRVPWLETVKKNPESFNKTSGVGDRLFGEAVSHALRMKELAVNEVRNFFRQASGRVDAQISAGKWDDQGRLDLSGWDVGAVRKAGTFPTRMLIFGVCLREPPCAKYSAIFLQQSTLNDMGAELLARALARRSAKFGVYRRWVFMLSGLLLKEMKSMLKRIKTWQEKHHTEEAEETEETEGKEETDGGDGGGMNLLRQLFLKVHLLLVIAEAAITIYSPLRRILSPPKSQEGGEGASGALRLSSRGYKSTSIRALNLMDNENLSMPAAPTPKTRRRAHLSPPIPCCCRFARVRRGALERPAARRA